MAKQVVKIRRLKNRKKVKGEVITGIYRKSESGKYEKGNTSTRVIRVRNGNYYKALRGFFNGF